MSNDVDITSLVTGVTNKHVSALAKQMRDEMKQIIKDGGHIRSGKAYDSINVYYNGRKASTADFEMGARGAMRGGFLTDVFIGSYERSAYYLDQGNGATESPITPKNGKYLIFEDTRRGKPKRKYFMPSVNTYEGIHFVEEVANRHR